MHLSTVVSVSKTQINFQSNDSSYIPGISMVGRTSGNHQITVYTWNPRLMLFIMSEVKSRSYWHVEGDVRISCANNRVSLLLNPDRLTSVPLGILDKEEESKTIDLGDKKIQDEAELKKLVLAQFDHKLYSNFTASTYVLIDERIKFLQEEFKYTRLPLETVVSLTVKAIAGEPVVYQPETEDA